MFNLTDETRAAMILLLRERLAAGKTDDELNVVIDEMVALVKAQFGF